METYKSALNKIIVKDNKQQLSKINNEYILKKSNRTNKKYMLITPENKHIHFGAKDMNDFTLFEDRELAEKRKKLYLQRHKKEEHLWLMNKENLETPSFLSRFILWNKPTVYASVNYIEHLLGIKIKLEL